MKTLRILAIDDHEMTMLGYKFILEGIEFDGHNIIVDTATSYHTGKKLIIRLLHLFYQKSQIQRIWPGWLP